MAVWIVLIVVSTVLFFIALIYNKLIRLRNTTENAWAAIDVQLHRRYDLIPALVQVAQGYAAHEKETFEEVTLARTAAISTEGRAQIADRNNSVTECLKKVFAIAESYPELEASDSFITVQEELSEAENLLAYARQYYNDVTLDFNNQLQILPFSFFARIFRFEVREYFSHSELSNPLEVKQQG